jgi:hypothetical protein
VLLEIEPRSVLQSGPLRILRLVKHGTPAP